MLGQGHDVLLTREVIGLAMHIHSRLGPGLFESVYETVLAGKLANAGHFVERQKIISIDFEGTHFPNAFKLDILVNRRLIVEVKAVDRLQPIHSRQLLTYLRLLELPLGLLINFNEDRLKDGIKRVANGFTPNASVPSVTSA